MRSGRDRSKVRGVKQLSVIIPFFNVEPYAAETLRTLQNNAAPGIEYILVDDGSTDSTPAILADGAARIPGATVLTMPDNVGLGIARNSGLDAACGRYVTFLDGDDFVATGYFADLVGAIQRLECDFVRTDHVQVRGRYRSVHRVAWGPRGVVCPARRGIGPDDRASAVDAPNIWAGIWDRRLLDAGLMHFDESLRTCEDRPWIWRMHMEAETFAVVGLLGVFYRREVATSLTQVSDERQFDFIPAFEGIVARVRTDPDRERFMPKAIRSFCAMMSHHMGQIDRYTPEMGQQLRTLIGAALDRLPAAELDAAVSRLDPTRAMLIQQLRSAA